MVASESSSKKTELPPNSLPDYTLKQETMVVVISDMHIGINEQGEKKFLEFLQSFNTQKSNLPNLKALVLLGDIWDLRLAGLDKLCEDYQYLPIMEELSKLHENREVELFWILGNHEAAVKDEMYPDRRKTVYSEFSERIAKFPGIRFLESYHIPQYLLLEPNFETLDWTLKGYDTIPQLQNQHPIIISSLGIPVPASTEKDYSALLSHGHRVIGFSIPTAFFEYLKLRDKPEDPTLPQTLWQKLSILYQYVKTGKDATPFLKRVIYKLVEDFIERTPAFQKVTKVIMGHVHEHLQQTQRIQKRDVEIICDGAWLHPRTPSIFEIAVDGTITGRFIV